MRMDLSLLSSFLRRVSQGRACCAHSRRPSLRRAPRFGSSPCLSGPRIFSFSRIHSRGTVSTIIESRSASSFAQPPRLTSYSLLFLGMGSLRFSNEKLRSFFSSSFPVGVSKFGAACIAARPPFLSRFRTLPIPTQSLKDAQDSETRRQGIRKHHLKLKWIASALKETKKTTRPRNGARDTSYRQRQRLLFEKSRINVNKPQRTVFA